MRNFNFKRTEAPRDKVFFCGACIHARKESEFIDGKIDSKGSVIRVCSKKIEVTYLSTKACDMFESR